MARPNYKQIEALLASKKEFKGNSLKARVEENGEYVVISYNTVIASFIEGVWWINPRKYSVTTTKQQNLIKRVARLDGWQDTDSEIW